MTTGPIDVARLIRIVTVAAALLVGALVYLSGQPEVDALGAKLDEARAELHADDVAFAELGAMRAERDALRARYDRELRENGEASFLNDLATTTRRHATRVVSTSTSEDNATTSSSDPSTVSPRVQFSIEVHGAYRNLLATIADLSRLDALVRVQTPNIRRMGDSLAATLPVTLYEPARGTP